MLTRYQDRAAGSHRFGPTDSTCLQGIRSGLQDRIGKAHPIEPAYEVSEGCCIISRASLLQGIKVRFHGFDKPDRICLLGIRTELQDLTGLEQQIQHAYAV